MAYYRKAWALYGSNFDNEYVYVLLDADRDACGFFADAEMAREYGTKNAKQWKEKCFRVNKQLILSNDNKNKVAKPWSSKHNLLKVPEYWESKYTGQEVSGIRYNNEGDILSIYSCEVSDEEQDKVDEQNKDRFEYQFFKIPFGMEAGTIVRMINNGEYAVLARGEGEWNEYMNRVGKNVRFYDFSDIQTKVYLPRNDANLSQEHVNT